jgi:hypothetical protein
MVLAYLGSQCTKCHAAGWTCWFVATFYLESWSLMRFRDGSDKGKASNCVQISEKVWRRTLQWLHMRSGKKAWAVHGTSRLAETENKTWACSSFFCRQEECSQRIPHTNVTFYGDCCENVRRLRPDLWRQKNWLLHHDNASSHISFFTRDFFYQKQHDCRPPRTLIFSASQIEDKTKRPPFWHNWDDRGRIAGDAEHPHRTQFPGCI